MVTYPADFRGVETPRKSAGFDPQISTPEVHPVESASLKTPRKPNFTFCVLAIKVAIQGYFAYEKTDPPRTLLQAYA